MTLVQTESPLDFQTPMPSLQAATAVQPADPLADLETVDVWGLPLARLTNEGTVDLVDRIIARDEPEFFITANLHYARLAAGDARLRRLNERAAFLTADGMPLVWQSRRQGQPLPERVAGSDLIYALCERAALRGHRVFFLGGADGVARTAADRLQEKYPLLAVAGVEAPQFGEMSEGDHAALVARIRAARPDLLLAALGQPKGELWLDEQREALGVPVCVQVGASIDFVAGCARRAPRWMQKTGLEWFYRMLREPRRLVPRYWGDAVFLARRVLGERRGRHSR